MTMTWEELVEYHRGRIPWVNPGDLLKLKHLDPAAIPMPDRSKLSELFPTEDKIVPEYFREIGKSTRELTPEQEEILLELLAQGDRKARDMLIEHYLPLVVALAWEYEQGRRGFLERIEEGNRCLMAAVDALSHGRQENPRAYIAEEIRRGVYNWVWDYGQIGFQGHYPLEKNLDQVLDRFGPQDGHILKELARAEDREQRLLELALEYDLQLRQIALTWRLAVRQSRKLQNQESEAEDSWDLEG